MIKNITSVKVANRRVIVRAGFDVPLKQNVHMEEWEVAEDMRIKEGLETLNYLIDNKAKIVILSKLGRPEGKWDENLSSWPVALRLGKLLNYKVTKIKDKIPDYKVPQIYFLTSDITKKDYSELSKKIAPASILYLENTFFYPGEETNDSDFVQILKKYGEVFVDEAFASAHHKAASNYGLAMELPCYAGVTLIREINALNKVLRKPRSPMVVLMGGAKIDDKVATLTNLGVHADFLIIGGALATTFLKAQGYETGKSKVSNVSIAKQILRTYKKKIILPIDLVVVTETKKDKPYVVKPEKMKTNEMVVDIGPESVRKIATIIKQAKTLIWNGPFGLFENPKFAFGSRALAHAFAARTKGPAYGVVGGGETVELVDQAKVAQFIDHISTGGGAMLEFLAGKKLPGIKVLER